MKARSSLDLVIELTGAQREQAMARLQQAHQADAFARSQMQQLADYLRETEQRWMSGARASVSPELLHHHYQFVARLTQAIQMQDGVLKGMQQRVEAAQQDLLAVELRLASYKQLLSTRQTAQTRAAQRREQKQMDEFANLQVQRLRTQQLENNP